jgi:hypothetical protein
VVIVAQAVDDRHAAPRRQFGQMAVVEYARHDAVHHTRQHAGDVADRLALTETDLALAEHDRAPAEVLHADIEADARAQRRLLEDHRQNFALQDRLVAACEIFLLQAQRVIEQRAQLVGGPVFKLDEVPHIALSAIVMICR